MYIDTNCIFESEIDRDKEIDWERNNIGRKT